MPMGEYQEGEQLLQLPYTLNGLKPGVAVQTRLSQGDPYHKPDYKTSFIGSFCTSPPVLLLTQHSYPEKDRNFYIELRFTLVSLRKHCRVQ